MGRCGSRQRGGGLFPALWVGLVSLGAAAGPTEVESTPRADLVKYIMWIPGRGGSTWATEMLARSHPRIMAETERFSGQAQACRDGGDAIPKCLDDLDAYWALPIQGNVLSKGFKVRPIMGWDSRVMLQGYADRGIRFVCNSRYDTIRHAISMYRHVLSRNHHSQTWRAVMQMLPGDTRKLNGTRIVIPGHMLSKKNENIARRKYSTRLDAHCVVNFGTYIAGSRIPNWQSMWLSDCTQNITFTMFDFMYNRAERLMKAVNSICIDYATDMEGTVHYINYESTQRAPQQEVNRMAAFLTGSALASTSVTAAPSRWTEHKVTANRVESSVPNIAAIVAAWWNRSACANGVIADPMVPLHLRGTGSIPSTHAIKSLLFAFPGEGRARPAPGIGGESPFVVIGSGLQWVGRLFTGHGGLRHAAVSGQGRPSQLPRTPAAVRCDGGCGARCRKSAAEFLDRPLNPPDRRGAPKETAVGVTVEAHSLASWSDTDRSRNPLTRRMVKRKAKLVCAVWENTIEGGLARLHSAKLESRGINPLHRCSAHGIAFAHPVPDECLHTLSVDEFRDAVNAVAIETFATLRYCHEYATEVGTENVFVIGHRPDTGGAATRTESLDRLAEFAGVDRWDAYVAAGHLLGSYHRFFPQLASVLREVLRTEVHMDMSIASKPEDHLTEMCAGCDAYSVADTFELLRSQLASRTKLS
eukprot:m.460499 g.460499  ORF g.460499 m.460499 type:complete len:699 (+) comp22049_c0_seq1:199-2295(+)